MRQIRYAFPFQVDDVNEAPTWDSKPLGPILLQEDLPLGTMIFSFLASDQDFSNNNKDIYYTIDSGLYMAIANMVIFSLYDHQLTL